MNQIEMRTQALIEAIKEGSVCKHYRDCERELEQVPGLKDRIDELRTASYNMYNQQSQDVDLFDAVDTVNKEFEQLRRVPEVNRYLEAELDFCKQLQAVHREIIGEMGISIPNFNE